MIRESSLLFSLPLNSLELRRPVFSIITSPRFFLFFSFFGLLRSFPPPISVLWGVSLGFPPFFASNFSHHASPGLPWPPLYKILHYAALRRRPLIRPSSHLLALFLFFSPFVKWSEQGLFGSPPPLFPSMRFSTELFNPSHLSPKRRCQPLS